MIHRDAGPVQLAILRIAVYGIWFAILFAFDADRFSRLPADLMDLHVLGGPVQAMAPLLPALKLAAMAGCALTVLGTRPHAVVAGGTAALILIADLAMKSIGSYANHAQVIVLFLALLLPFFPAADALSPFRRTAPSRSAAVYRTPLQFGAILLAVSYTLIAARRVFIGGVAIYTDGVMTRWVVARTLEEGAHDISIGLSVLDHPWLGVPLALALLVTTVAELLSPFALTRPRFRLAWLAVIVGFHLSTLMLMNIFFWENLVLLAVLFTPLADRVARRFSQPTPAV